MKVAITVVPKTTWLERVLTPRDRKVLGKKVPTVVTILEAKDQHSSPILRMHRATTEDNFKVNMQEKVIIKASSNTMEIPSTKDMEETTSNSHLHISSIRISPLVLRRSTAHKHLLSSTCSSRQQQAKTLEAPIL